MADVNNSDETRRAAPNAEHGRSKRCVDLCGININSRLDSSGGYPAIVVEGLNGWLLTFARIFAGGGLAAVQVWAGRGPVPDGAAVSSAVTSQGKGEIHPRIYRTANIQYWGKGDGWVALATPLNSFSRLLFTASRCRLEQGNQGSCSLLIVAGGAPIGPQQRGSTLTLQQADIFLAQGCSTL